MTSFTLPFTLLGAKRFAAIVTSSVTLLWIVFAVTDASYHAHPWRIRICGTIEIIHINVLPGGRAQDSVFFPAQGIAIQPLLNHLCASRLQECIGDIMPTFSEFSGTNGLVKYQVLRIPFWTIWMPCAAILAWLYKLSHDSKFHECVRCRYDLRGTVSPVCSECGLPIPPEQLVQIRAVTSIEPSAYVCESNSGDNLE